jgi:hypothetical protein
MANYDSQSIFAPIIIQDCDIETTGGCSPFPRQVNKNDPCALSIMPNKQPPSDSTGPMGMQPLERARSAPTQMLPLMPRAQGEPQGTAKTPAPEKKPRTRTQAVRVALARMTRRNSLRKQRAAQKG